MQITIDDNTFHKWALDRGYVRLTDIADFVRMRNWPIETLTPSPDAPIDRWLQQKQMHQNSPDMAAPVREDTLGVAALENLDDLKPAEPVPTLKEVTDALRQVVSDKGVPDAQKLLSDFEASKIGDVPEARRSEFLAAAAKVLLP